jgi:HlyD family type I secretion membrane fusion protein
MNMQASTPRPMSDKFVIRSALMCAIGLGGFMLWAGFAELAQGVPASGQVVVENSRQIVQHLEGGIIEEIMVRDGDRVESGDSLLRLDTTASLASRDLVLQEIASHTASMLRLNALSEGLGEPDFSTIATMGLGGDELDQVVTRQRDLYRQQLQSFEADISVLTARRDGAQSSRVLQGRQILIAGRGLAAAQEQLSLLRDRYDRQMARLDEVRSMEREVASLEADLGRLRTEAQQAETFEQDLDGQIAQTEAEFARQISAESLDVRVNLQSAEERLSAAQDVLNRSIVLAPRSGEVLNMRFSTRGGVVGAGESILEIVPHGGEVIAEVRIRPSDRAAVFEGQAVRTQITAYKSWATPRLDGEVVSVSADLKTDRDTGVTYYEVRVMIPESELTKLQDLAVIPGMPVEVFIFSGNSRTTLDYLLEPISESLFRGARSG